MRFSPRQQITKASNSDVSQLPLPVSKILDQKSARKRRFEIRTKKEGRVEVDWNVSILKSKIKVAVEIGEKKHPSLSTSEKAAYSFYCES